MCLSDCDRGPIRRKGFGMVLEFFFVFFMFFDLMGFSWLVDRG